MVGNVDGQINDNGAATYIVARALSNCLTGGYAGRRLSYFERIHISNVIFAYGNLSGSGTIAKLTRTGFFTGNGTGRSLGLIPDIVVTAGFGIELIYDTVCSDLVVSSNIVVAPAIAVEPSVATGVSTEVEAYVIVSGNATESIGNEHFEIDFIQIGFCI